jgi:hypothetical protein
VGRVRSRGCFRWGERQCGRWSLKCWVGRTDLFVVGAISRRDWRSGWRGRSVLCALLVGVGVCAVVVVVAHGSTVRESPHFVALGAGGELRQPLAFSAAAALPGGDVLVAGGLAAGGLPPGSTAASARLELFDASRGTFRYLSGRLRKPVDDPVAATLPGGKVLISGWPGYGSSAIAEEFNASKLRLSLLSARPLSDRYFAVAAPLPGGDMLIAGGTAFQPTPPPEVFDAATQQFRWLHASTRVWRINAVAAPLPNGDVLIAGGTGRTLNNALASAEIYAPATNSFRLLRSHLAIGVWGAMATELTNGDVLIAGGVVTGYKVTNRAELFDPRTNTFRLLSARLAVPTYGGSAARLPGGRALFAGGSGSLGYGGPGWLRTAEIYEP